MLFKQTWGIYYNIIKRNTSPWQHMNKCMWAIFQIMCFAEVFYRKLPAIAWKSQTCTNIIFLGTSLLCNIPRISSTGGNHIVVKLLWNCCLGKGQHRSMTQMMLHLILMLLWWHCCLRTVYGCHSNQSISCWLYLGICHSTTLWFLKYRRKSVLIRDNPRFVLPYLEIT